MPPYVARRHAHGPSHYSFWFEVPPDNRFSENGRCPRHGGSGGMVGSAGGSMRGAPCAPFVARGGAVAVVPLPPPFPTSACSPSASSLFFTRGMCAGIWLSCAQKRGMGYGQCNASSQQLCYMLEEEEAPTRTEFMRGRGMPGRGGLYMPSSGPARRPCHGESHVSGGCLPMSSTGRSPTAVCSKHTQG